MSTSVSVPSTTASATATVSLQSTGQRYEPAIASPSPPPTIEAETVAPTVSLKQQEEPKEEATTTVPPTATFATPPTTTASTTAKSTTPNSTTRDVEDGKHYVNRKCLYPPRCKEHKPTLEELQKFSFSEYVRQVVLEGARVSYEDEVAKRNPKGGEEPVYIEEMELNQNGFPSKPIQYAEGMAKVTLPQGFWKEEGIGQDRTGRGPAWQKGTPLGDLVIPNPIKQCVRGIGGVYEYTLLDQRPIALHALREEADIYFEEQICGKKRPVEPAKKKVKITTPESLRTKRLQLRNEVRKEEEEKEAEVEPKEEEEAKQEEEPSTPVEEKKEEEKEKEKEEQSSKKKHTVEELERKFWKRLGPTMPPATYGADMEGSLFGDDPASGWNLGQLDSFLMLLGPSLPGVTSPYLYMGMWASVFAVHTEDMNLLSINYLHAGAPKIWYAVAPGPDAKRLEALSEHYFAHSHHDCKQFLRHKRSLLSPATLKKAGIKYTMQIQNPGDAMITLPGGYHFGFNTGFNVAEATNFGVPEWIPFGHEARICMCRPDSVRIDMMRLQRLLTRYTKEQKKKTARRRKSFRDWGILHAKAHSKPPPESESDTESEEEEDANNKSSNTPTPSPKQPKKPRMKDFWVEVMAPVPSSQRADYGRKVTVGHQPKKAPVPRKRPLPKGKQQPKIHKEVWHLAKPMTRKALIAGSKVLVMIPGSTAGRRNEPESSDSSDSDESGDEDEDEQCFAGTITEFSEEHCRVHFAALPKDDDVWMHIFSTKLFLDGGKWDESNDEKGLPARHYWQELDSKRRCV